MRKKWWMFLLIPPVIVLCGWIFGEIVMNLWNWLLPPLFGWHMITFWQALGLLLLSRILFGSWGSGGGKNKRRWRGEKWQQMSPEEREQLRQSWRSRCGGFADPPSTSKEPA